MISLGIFATLSANPAGADGLLLGNIKFFGFELLSVVVATGWAFKSSYLALVCISIFTPVRVSHDEEMKGLDASLHGEDAYMH